MYRKRIFTLFAGLALVLASGLGYSQQARPSAPQNAPADPAPAQSAPPTPASAQSAADDQYIVGPGDTLQIVVWRAPELSDTVPVRPDGKISTPLVENLVAVGKTPSQLARDVEKVLSEYVRSPRVTIIVTQPVSAYSQVQVVGQVPRPQSVPYREGMKVLDLMIQVGGLGQFASGNRARIVRMQDGKQIEIRVKLANLLEKGDLKQNVPIRPGDVLVVPETFF